MSIFQLLDKKNWYCPFNTAIPMMQHIVFGHLAWGIVSVLLFFALLFSNFMGDTFAERLPFALVPLVVGLFFLFLAFRVYLLIRTGSYTVLQGICTESPRGINPLPMVSNYFKNRLSLSFTMSEKNGIVAYSVRSTRSKLPREGDQVIIAITQDSIIQDSPTEYQVLSYLGIRYMTHAAIDRKNKKTKG